MKIKVIKVIKARAPAEIKKETRIPNTLANTPPSNGPITPPAVKAPCITPIQKPSFSLGA